ncbi:MAG: DUF11 domain-containing protein [Sphingopyxis sp.]|nr:DUF11 domain-containing protein [Sphingopyxis sp.]
MRMFLLMISALTASAPALANPVSLSNNVFVERVSTDAQGNRKVVLEEPRVVTPGDRLLFVLNYRNASGKPAEKFVVTNPMPSAVQYAEQGEGTAQVSVDGGKNWGELGQLRVADANGADRAARNEDVTHIRWAFNTPIPAGASGKLMFRGIVK